MAGEKIGQARKGALEFGEEALKRGYAVGLIQFASASTTRRLSEPSRSLADVRASLERLEVDGSTNMSFGINLAREMVGDQGNRVICIVTDGMPDSVPDAIASALAARESGIEIMAVGTDDADWNFLSQIVTRRELAAKVERAELQSQLANMAKQLPLLGK
jgi:Ca-activated chloride channel family protein